MKALELQTNCGLVLPATYLDISNDEMEYLDGGWNVDTHWWGVTITLTHNDVSYLQSSGEANLIRAIVRSIPGGQALALGLTAEAYLFSKLDRGNGVEYSETWNGWLVALKAR